MLGRALKRMADGLDLPPRGVEAAAAAKLYQDLFETTPPPNAAKMRRYKTVPHAYVLFTGDGATPLALAPGDTAVVGLTLVGHANRMLPAILSGFHLGWRDQSRWSATRSEDVVMGAITLRPT